MTTSWIPLLILMLSLPATEASGQEPDSLVTPALAWTVFEAHQWDRIAGSLPSSGDTGGVQVTMPQVHGPLLVIYGRAWMPILEEEAIGWLRQVPGHLTLYLSSVPFGEIGSRVTRRDVFAAQIGPLKPGRYEVQVIWKPLYGPRAMIERTLYNEPVIVP